MVIPENWAPETLVGPLWDPAKTKKNRMWGENGLKVHVKPSRKEVKWKFQGSEMSAG